MINFEKDYMERLISERDAAIFLHHSVKTLQGWRCKGVGPRYVRILRAFYPLPQARLARMGGE